MFPAPILLCGLLYSLVVNLCPGHLKSFIRYFIGLLSFPCSKHTASGSYFHCQSWLGLLNFPITIFNKKIFLAIIIRVIKSDTICAHSNVEQVNVSLSLGHCMAQLGKPSGTGLDDTSCLAIRGLVCRFA